MSDNDFKMHREIGELKAEVERSRRVIKGIISVVAVVVILIFPQFLILAAVGAIGFFGFLSSPLGRKIFSDNK